MEDYILGEIDRIGEMLQHIARRLGLLNDNPPDYSLTDVKEEFGNAGCPIDLDALLLQENPVWYLVDQEKLSDHGLETMIDIIFHSDLDEDRKQALLSDAHCRSGCEGGHINGYLTDTCLTAQDNCKALLDYFKIKYQYRTE